MTSLGVLSIVCATSGNLDDGLRPFAKGHGGRNQQGPVLDFETGFLRLGRVAGKESIPHHETASQPCIELPRLIFGASAEGAKQSHT